MIDTTINNGRAYKEFFSGFIIDGKDKIPFRYAVIKTRSYDVQSSLMPGMEYIQPNEIIRTTRLDLNIRKDMYIILADNRKMTVLTAEKDIDINRAYMTGNGDIAWRITLQGGAL